MSDEGNIYAIEFVRVSEGVLYVQADTYSEARVAAGNLLVTLGDDDFDGWVDEVYDVYQVDEVPSGECVLVDTEGGWM